MGIKEIIGLSKRNKNGFQLHGSTADDTLIADDEYTRILVFEPDELQKSFTAEGEEL